MANTCLPRHQKSRQPGDYPGYDEDWCAENPLEKQCDIVGLIAMLQGMWRKLAIEITK